MKRLSPRLWLAAALSLTAPMLVSCGSDSGGSVDPTPIRVSKVQMTPLSASSEAIGERIQFQAQPQDAEGAPVPATVEWSSGNEAVATVSGSGLVTTVSDGTAVITATATLTSQGVTTSASGTAPVSVEQKAAGVAVSISQMQLAVGETETVTATVVDSEGTAVPGETATWSSADDEVVTVSQEGLFTAVGKGSAMVTAAHESGSSPVAVDVVGQPADSVILTPATDTIPVDLTSQFTAVLLGPTGDTIEAESKSWTSSVESVATVDSDGLATALTPGTTTISVTLGSGGAQASATAELVVIENVPDFKPEADTTLTGDVTVTDLEVAAGVTVTLAGETTITALGEVMVEGDMTGNCTPLNVDAAGRVTITGSVSTACAAAPDEGDEADVTIVSSTGFTLDGASITSGGSVSIRSEGEVAPNPTVAPVLYPGALMAAMANEESVECFLMGANIEAEDGQSFKDDQSAYGEGLNGLYGGDVEVHCGRNRLVITGSHLQSGDGGDGENARSEDAETVAKGGNGREAGRILLSSDVAVHFTELRGSTSVFAGSGGEGGNAVAEGWPQGTAIGGDGGPGGQIQITVPSAGGLIFVETAEDLNMAFGGGGDAGNAEAEGLPGANATETSAALKGGDAFATGGTGGNNIPQESATLFGDILVGPVSNPGNVIVQGGEGGHGGSALASGGGGGAANQKFKEGGGGGDMNATGGEGGKMVVTTGAANYLGGGIPGFGGMASLLNGDGGPGFDGCSVTPWEEGGAGGGGGNTGGSDGAGGTSVQGEPQSDHGDVRIDDAGWGGLGGDGDGPGSGGAAGTDGTTANGNKEVNSSFEPGEDGEQCYSETAMGTDITTKDDPSDHEYYIGFTAIVYLTLVQLAANQWMVTGAAPWVALTGVINELSLLALSGRGVVAGYPNILVLMTVALVFDSLNQVIGFNGTIEAGADEGLPGGESATYDVTAEKTEDGSFRLQLKDPSTGAPVDPADVGLDEFFRSMETPQR